MGTAKTRASNKYNQKAYDRLNLVVAKGQREIIQQAAADRGESVNGLILRLLRQEIPELSEAPRSDGD